MWLNHSFILSLSLGLLFCLIPGTLTQDLDDVDIDDDMLMEEMEDEFADIAPGEEEPAPPLEIRAKPEYKAPVPKQSSAVFFEEHFESEEDFKKRWVISKAKKDGTDEEIAKYDGKWNIEEPRSNAMDGDLGLVLKSKAKHHAVAARLNRPFQFVDKPFVIQYEVKFQNGQDCGGAYVKLLSDGPSLDLANFNDKTPYTIMFGPDKCGNDHKLHFIFRHLNPLNGEFEEKHAKKPSAALESYFTDKKFHLLTLVVMPDNSFQTYFDNTQMHNGNLLEDMDPAVNPEKEIVDPNDKKPEDWDEREKIPDPEAVKPEDWDEDEPEFVEDMDAVKPSGWLDDEDELIPDPDAEMPEDWEPEMDGDWEAAMINNPVCESAPGCGEWNAPQMKNPKYKGKWRAPLISNPSYKGKWKAKMIENPDYFEDKEPFKMTDIGAIGLELWSMSDDILFDNIIITNLKVVADDYAEDSWEIKHQQELLGDGSGRSVVDAVLDATNERPWLWAVFILVVVLPVILVIAYCCMSSSKPDDIAKHKKTDEDTPADEAAKEASTEETKSEAAGGDASPATKNQKKKGKSSKADLETEQGEEGDAEDEPEEEEEDPAQTRSSPRLRKSKARKD